MSGLRLDAGLLLGAAALIACIVAVLAPLGLTAVFGLAGALGLALHWQQGSLRGLIATPLATLLVALSLWALASAAWAIVPEDALSTIRGVAPLLLAALVLIGLRHNVDAAAQHRLSQLLVLGFALGLALVLIETVSGFAILRLLRFGRARDFGLTALDRAAVLLMLLAFPVAIALRRDGQRLLPYLALLAAPLPSLFANTQSARVAAVSGLVMAGITWFAGWRWVRGVGVALATLVVVAPMLPQGPLAPDKWTAWLSGLKNSAGHRLRIWEFVSGNVAEHPFAGWGMDASRSIPGGTAYFPTGGQKLSLHPHNAALQLWLELGLVGALLGAALVLLALWSISRIEDRFARAAAAGMAVAAFVMANLGFGIWQNWWLATLGLTAAVTAAVSARTA